MPLTRTRCKLLICGFVTPCNRRVMDRQGIFPGCGARLKLRSNPVLMPTGGVQVALASVGAALWVRRTAARQKASSPAVTSSMMGIMSG